MSSATACSNMYLDLSLFQSLYLPYAHTWEVSKHSMYFCTLSLLCKRSLRMTFNRFIGFGCLEETAQNLVTFSLLVWELERVNLVRRLRNLLFVPRNWIRKSRQSYKESGVSVPRGPGLARSRRLCVISITSVCKRSATAIRFLGSFFCRFWVLSGTLIPRWFFVIRQYSAKIINFFGLWTIFFCVGAVSTFFGSHLW